MIGERLFYGLIPLGEKAMACASCHNTNVTDTLNWNPSALDIAVSTSAMTQDVFTALILNPDGDKISTVHYGYDLSADQLVMIRAFLEEVRHEGLIKMKPVVTRRFLYIFAILVILAAFGGIIVNRKWHFRLILTLVLLAASVYVTWVTVIEAIAVGRSPGYAPDQPVKFSHAVHAGQNKMDCRYCHSSAAYSKSATIPALGVCLNCHQYVVREGTRSGTFEIRKITKAVEYNEPVVWNRVYSLPDHVFFSHAQHVSIGKLDCATCHGAVETMDILGLYSDLSMGWCINCHRDTQVQFAGNVFYTKYARLHEQLMNGERKVVNVENIGGIECMKCHY
jgi:cytochrome c553